MDFSGRSLQEWFPYATLSGLTVGGYMFGVSLQGLLEEFHTFYT